MREIPVLKVSEITRFVKTVLEEGFPDAIVEGEISNFRPAASGHRYFSLKDKEAVLACVQFRGATTAGGYVPRDGDLVRARGAISVYPPRGTYQLVIREMHAAGRGRILELLEERKRRFAAEGLFDREQPLPRFPRTAAIITSPTGAAIRDIIQVLRRRRAGLDVRILPAPVQGSAAASVIARMIEYADRWKLGDVIVVTRGGGSLEDLLPFSEEVVVRAIAACTTPVISAVGHEIDWALTDFAADYRAPTPSAAAEILSAGEGEIRDRLERANETIRQELFSRLERYRARLERVAADEIRYRYRNFVQPWFQRLDNARDALETGIRDRIVSLSRRLELGRERTAGASPFLALQRGYAIVRDVEADRIVTRAATTIPHQRLRVEFSDGGFHVVRSAEPVNVAGKGDDMEQPGHG